MPSAFCCVFKIYKSTKPYDVYADRIRQVTFLSSRSPYLSLPLESIQKSKIGRLSKLETKYDQYDQSVQIQHVSARVGMFCQLKGHWWKRDLEICCKGSEDLFILTIRSICPTPQWCTKEVFKILLDQLMGKCTFCIVLHVSGGVLLSNDDPNLVSMSQMSQEVFLCRFRQAAGSDPHSTLSRLAPTQRQNLWHTYTYTNIVTALGSHIRSSHAASTPFTFDITTFLNNLSGTATAFEPRNLQCSVRICAALVGAQKWLWRPTNSDRERAPSSLSNTNVWCP